MASYELISNIECAKAKKQLFKKVQRRVVELTLELPSFGAKTKYVG